MNLNTKSPERLAIVGGLTRRGAAGQLEKINGMDARVTASIRLAGIIAAVCGIAALATLARADEPMSFRGKSVRMIVGSAAGGVTDLEARLIGRFIGKYLPGSPAILVQNVPGASGIKALNYFV